MLLSNKRLNLVMSGGGIKGIAYIGVADVAERRGYTWGNISGVSAGALAGSFMASGLSARQMWDAMYKFDFEGVQVSSAAGRIPAVQRYMEYIRLTRSFGPDSVEQFLNMRHSGGQQANLPEGAEVPAYRWNLLNNIITFAKEGCLFDGDYLEEWTARVLAGRGIRTFADLRTGKVDSTNPNGYRIRVTGVDLNRAKLVVLPDDAAIYGIEPDSFEVAKAVRISTCVPFAFKPVEMKVKEGKTEKVYNLVDGGVFDRFPYWLVENTARSTVGFKLSGGEKPSFFSINTPLNMLKSLISAVHDIGVPKGVANEIKFIGEINTTKVHYLDFNLSDEDKEYLYSAGRQTAILTFNRFEESRKKRRL
jgi:NTE family protein